MKLTATDLHIWHIQLGDEQNLLNEQFPELPCSLEQKRLDDFSHPKLRQLYLKTRWAMRDILACYLNIEASNVRLTTTELGKPELATQAHSLDLRFNLTHSAEMALFAVTLGNEVGIDLEKRVARPKAIKLAARYFTPEVVKQLEELDDSAQQAALLNLWTQYEAFKKAQGLGLRGGEGKLPLKMGLTPNQLYPFPKDSGEGSGWLVTQLCNIESYHAAVVVEANQSAYQIRHITGDIIENSK